jgi:hypothetical protein
VKSAARIRLDVYGGEVACDGARVKMPATPQLSRTFDNGAVVAADVGAGAHTIVLSTLDAAGRETGSACARGDWSAGSSVCVELAVQPLVDAGAFDVAPIDAGCTTPDECVMPRSCRANQKLEYATGMCVDGACVYGAPRVTECPQGCYDGDCTGGLTALDPAQAYVAGTTTSVALAEVSGTGAGGGIAPSGSGVEVRIGFAPRGTGRALTLRYSVDGFASQSSLAMSFVAYAGSDRELWSATLPPQPAGAHVLFYVEADGWDNTVL